MELSGNFNYFYWFFCYYCCSHKPQTILRGLEINAKYVLFLLLLLFMLLLLLLKYFKTFPSTYTYTKLQTSLNYIWSVGSNRSYAHNALVGDMHLFHRHQHSPVRYRMKLKKEFLWLVRPMRLLCVELT